MTMIEPNRRGFITGLIALVAAPAIVRAGSLMPVRRMIELGEGDRMPYLASPMDIRSVVRRAFVPRLYVRMWNENPVEDLIRSLQ
jgi:hypothetical protein